MSLKETIIKSLQEINSPANHRMICRYIIDNKYHDFYKSKTPEATISALLGDLIRENHPNVKRIENGKHAYLYEYIKIHD